MLLVSLLCKFFTAPSDFFYVCLNFHFIIKTCFLANLKPKWNDIQESPTMQLWYSYTSTQYNNICAVIISLWRPCTSYIVTIDNSSDLVLFCLVLWCWRHFQQYFSYIMAISFIGGGNRSTRENHLPVASHWQTLSHNVVSTSPCQELGSNSQMWSLQQVWLWLIYFWKWQETPKILILIPNQDTSQTGYCLVISINYETLSA